jgi:hypothetical protein
MASPDDDLGPAMDGPAFPTDGFTGMSLRDYFAGQAITGAMSIGVTLKTTMTEREVAECCYRIADAMLAARWPNHWRKP